MTESQPTPSAEPSSLLPPILCGPAAFLWLWALPVAILLILNLQSFALVGGNLDADQSTTALILGLANLGNLIGALTLAILGFRWKSQGRPDRLRHHRWSILMILVQAGYLWMATVYAEEMLPRSVTSWIFPEARYFFNQYAFSMLPLFFGIMRLAGIGMHRGSRAVSSSLLMALLPPAILYLFCITVLEHGSRGGAEVAFGVLLVAMGVVMFTGIIRLTLVILRLIRKGGLKAELIAIIIIGLALPLGGLALNRNVPFPVDLQATEVYALVVINMLMLAIASLHRERRPWLCIGLLCTTLPYSLYFFLVFLPYTPLSIIATIVFGLGFLVLTPTFLFTLHLHLLNQARLALPAGTRLRSIWLLGLGCFFILPAAFTVRALADRTALNSALDYIYTPSVDTGDMHYDHSLVNLRRAVTNHRDYKDGLYYPFLSEAYAWLVFDNLVLSDPKLDRIETVFFGEATASSDNRHDSRDFFGRGSNRDRNRMPRANPPPREVSVSDWKLQPNEARDSGDTTVTLMLKLEIATGIPQSEYIAHLPLPAGVFVSGFRLHVDGRPVPGRITEKKTALWAYTMIRDIERRDPGLLFYDHDGGLELRVYPVVAEKPSIVEIDFLLPPGADFDSIATNATTPAEALAGLAAPAMAAPTTAVVTPTATVLTLPPTQLPVVHRTPYLHLIVDRSQKYGYEGDWHAALPALRLAFPDAIQARVTLANHNTRDVVPDLTDLDALGAIEGGSLKAEGSLSLDLVLARAIRRHRDFDLDRPVFGPAAPPYPIFIILSKGADGPAPELPLTEAWSDCLPGLEVDYLDANLSLHPFIRAATHDAPLLRLGDSIRPLVHNRTLEFATTASGLTHEYWSERKLSWMPLVDIAFDPAETSAWTRAVALQQRQQAFLRSPGSETDDLKSLVLASRETGVLIPSTSYIVVENDAQWKAMERAEDQKLDQNAALDHKEAPAPAVIWIILPFGSWLLFRRPKRSEITPDERSKSFAS